MSSRVSVRRSPLAVAAVVALLLLLPALAVAYPSTYGTSGLSGGGTVNVLATPALGSTCASGGTRDLLYGGDVYGAGWSSTGGAEWKSASYGMSADQQSGVAAAAYGVGSTEAYLWVGRDSGLPAQLLVNSSCGLPGASTPWAAYDADPAAGTPYLGSTNGNRPREVGHLMVALSSTEILVGADNGLFVFTRTSVGSAWCTGVAPACHQLAALSGKVIRGIVVDPQDPDTLWVSYSPDLSAAGVDGVTQLHWDGTRFGFTIEGAQMSGWGDGHDFDVAAVVQNDGMTHLYVARGKDGVYQCVRPTAGLFTCTNAAFPASGTGTVLDGSSYWVSLAVMADPTAAGSNTDNVLIFAGCSATDPPNPAANCPGGKSIAYRTHNTQWSSATTSVTTNLITVSAGSPTWWLSPENGYMMGGNRYSTSQLMLDSDAGSGKAWLYSAGRAGIWRTTLTGLTSPSGTVTVGQWAPAVNGIPGSGVRHLSGSLTGNVAIGDGDWSGAVSTTSLGVGGLFENTSTTGTTYSTASWTATSGTTPDHLFFGTGTKSFNDTSNQSRVRECDLPATGGTSCGCPARTLGCDWETPVTTAGVTARVVGLAVGQRPDQTTGNAYEVIAATETQGIFIRASGNGSIWQQVSYPLMGATPAGPCFTQTPLPQNHFVSLIWSTGAQYLFVYDPVQKTLFRSPDLSGTWPSGPWAWDRIWLKSGNTNNQGTNYVVGALANYNQTVPPTALYASTVSGVYKLTGLGQPTVNDSVMFTTTVGGAQQVLTDTGPIALDRPPGSGISDRLVVTRSYDADIAFPRPGLYNNGTSGTLLTAVQPIEFLNQAMNLDAAFVSNPGGGVDEHIYIGNHDGGGVLVAPAPTK